MGKEYLPLPLRKDMESYRKDDLVFTSGDYTITSAKHGISGKDSVRIANGSIRLYPEKMGYMEKIPRTVV